ncbi:Lipoprotein-anchoring transpeptidase ErfK/SrfK [Prosthecobacter debontii]|uniref:Lipoprotein-anchoring transpeptidase ErfK/SrfK n=1 Tax=Prosthecobacter debontii TaxID=48467 RepID=A0A1T4YDF1_9BACT|nr:L,D-transpeptidase family protein [Prosthecobacter debontii]SKA99568.1 Lipoprotein-anchoring transpeptidase ErfK/SrfK [Prosthecobacter debontii]
MRLPVYASFLLATHLLTAQIPIAVPVPEETILRAEPVLPKAPEPVEEILRLQIYLDTQLFGPGKVDGRPGEFTSKALHRHQRALGQPPTDIFNHTLDLTGIGQTYTTYTLRQEDLKFVGELPSQPSAQSKKKYLPYDSVLEFLTERFHCSPDLLEFINQPLKMSALKPGDVVKVPNVQPFLIEELTPLPSLPEVPAFLTRVIKIDTREKILELHEGEKLLASLPITPGSGYLATPPGTWRIVGITQMPTFRWDKSVLEYGVRSGTYYNLPPGPNNPVGVMWIGLSKPGIGIHGTNSPQTIGRSSSHGCMRTANWDVVRLAKQLTKGMTVIIEGEAPVPRPVVKAKPVVEEAPPAEPEAPQKKFRWFWQKRE